MTTTTERLLERVTGRTKRRRPLTTEERAAQSARMRAAWQDGRFAARRKPMHRRAWTPEQDRVLTALAGTRPVPEIAGEIERRFHIRRTEAGLRIRAKRLGISLWQGGYALIHLERIFGVDHRVIVRHWVEAGHLAGRRWDGRGPNAGWWFDGAEVERFVRECGWLYALERMEEGHRLARLAEMAQREEPWVVGLDALCGLLGLAACNVKRWMARGLIPHRRRPGAGGMGEICVRGRDIPSIREAIAAAQTAALSAGSRRRRAASVEAARQQAERLVGACRNGHPRTPETTLITTGGKLQCRTCRAVRLAKAAA